MPDLDKPVISEQARRWLDGEMTDEDYFALSPEDAAAIAREVSAYDAAVSRPPRRRRWLLVAAFAIAALLVWVLILSDIL